MLVHAGMGNQSGNHKGRVGMSGLPAQAIVPPTPVVRFRLWFDPNPPPLCATATREEAAATTSEQTESTAGSGAAEPNDSRCRGYPHHRADERRSVHKKEKMKEEEEEEDICWGGTGGADAGTTKSDGRIHSGRPHHHHHHNININHKRNTTLAATSGTTKTAKGKEEKEEREGAVGEKGSLPAPSEHEELVVPIKQHLSTITVDYLTQEFKRRLQRKYPLLAAVMDVSHYLLRQPSEAAIIDLPSLEEEEESQQQQPWRSHGTTRDGSRAVGSSPSSSAAAGSLGGGASLFFGEAIGKRPGGQNSNNLYWRIDTKMNFDDTLDDFFMPANSATGGERQYEVVVVWANANATEEESTRTVSATTLTTTAAAATCGEKPVIPLRQPQNMRLGECLRLSEARMNEKARRELFFPAPAPAISVTQRSTYLDLLKQRATRREEDKERAYHRIIRERQTGEKGSDMPSDQPNGSVVTRLDEARHGERVALATSEREARAALLEEEAKAHTGLVELASESWRHVLTLLTLHENFLTNGKWVEMVRRHMKYPFDTEPLAQLPTAEEKEALRERSDDTAVMSFCFRDMEAVRKAKLRAEAEERARLAEAARDHFRDEMLDLALEERAREKKAKRNALRTAFFREQGYAEEEIPPPTPTPPPTPPPPRDPTLEELDAAYEDLLDLYLEFRHEIIALERKDFREMAQLMRAVLMRQERADEAAVRLAYEEELQATAALDLDAYLSYDLDQLEQETEFVEPWVLAERERQQAEEDRERREKEGAAKHAETGPTEMINVVHRETEEELRSRLEAMRYNPFRPDKKKEGLGKEDRQSDRPPAHDDVEFLEEDSEDRLQRRLEVVRFTFREKKAREAIIVAQREEMQSIFDKADLVLQKVQGARKYVYSEVLWCEGKKD